MSSAGEWDVQWVTPLPPLRTGISRYSLDLLRAVDCLWKVGAIVEDGSLAGGFKTVRASSLNQLRDDLPLVIQIGNSEHHRTAFQFGLERSGILVLHDVVLHHALLTEAVRRGKMQEHWQVLQDRYGQAGVDAGRELLYGRASEDYAAYPLSEPYIERAKLTLVHSQFAQQLVQRICPGAAVERIRMGIPIPADIDRDEARAALKLPESSFIVASITHVNPYKRLPVVLRAMRKLVARLPEARLVLAGAGSDGRDLKWEISQRGLDGFVSTWGFVDEPRARLLAAASDACVNLRYPSTGETSASLLRLLGAGRPVLVSDVDATGELPPGVALPVPVDGFEVDMLTETLWSLAMDSDFRAASGRLARQYVVERHGMGAAVDGYRDAIERVYGVALPGLEGDQVMEPALDLEAFSSDRQLQPVSTITALVSGAMRDLGIGEHEATLQVVANAMVDLGLDPGPVRERAFRAG